MHGRSVWPGGILIGEIKIKMRTYTIVMRLDMTLRLGKKFFFFLFFLRLVEFFGRSIVLG